METYAVDLRLVKKWERVFTFLDVDQDGVLRKADFDRLQQKLLENHEPSGDKKAETEKFSNAVWEDAMRVDASRGGVTRDQFIQILAKGFAEGRMPDEMKSIRTKCFYAMDCDDDGLINVDEFCSSSDIVGGRSITTYLKRAFYAIDVDGDGLISLEDYLGAYVGYMCDPEVKLEDMPLYGLDGENDGFYQID